MVSVICKDGEFLVKGSFFMGNAGTYRNEDYGEGNIRIDINLEDLVEHLEKGYHWMKPLEPLMEQIPKDGDSLAKMYEEYLNGMEEKVRRNIKQINDYFWYEMLTHMVDCEYPFWEVEEAILPEYRGECTEEECLDAYENQELDEAMSKLYEEYDEVPNDGSVEKTDVEALLKRVFPMFNLDGMASSIVPEDMDIEGGMLQIQFSDGWDNTFFCAAVAQFDDHLTPSEWDNF